HAAAADVGRAGRADGDLHAAIEALDVGRAAAADDRVAVGADGGADAGIAAEIDQAVHADGDDDVLAAAGQRGDRVLRRLRDGRIAGHAGDDGRQGAGQHDLLVGPGAADDRVVGAAPDRRVAGA